jgi:hypothetical protein
MQRIKPEPVVQSVLRLLGIPNAGAQVPARPVASPVISDAPDGRPLGLVIRASLRSDSRE